MPRKRATTSTSAKAKAKPPTPAHSPPQPRYNTRATEAKASTMSQADASDDEDVEELPWYPRYKDDLPNAFNGDVDASKDYISKLPGEIVDEILSYLVLDHEPDLGVRHKEGDYKHRPHALISMSAMSRSFYHATETFTHGYLTKHRDSLKYNLREAAIENQVKQGSIRRSARIASKPEERHEVFRTQLMEALQIRCAVCHYWCSRPGRLANAVNVCSMCESALCGDMMTLTDALKAYDLRDWMLFKSRSPGPRTKIIDLPTIAYGSEYKVFMGFYPAKTAVFSFARKDVEMIANLVHSDLKEHMKQHEEKKRARALKARRERIRALKIRYHQFHLEITKGKTAAKHEQYIEQLRQLKAEDVERFVGEDVCTGCGGHHYYEDEPFYDLCDYCGDVPGRYDPDDCMFCFQVWADNKWEKYHGLPLY